MLWQMDVDVVRRVIGPVPGEIDALITDIQCPVVLEGFFRRRSGWVVVPQQEPPVSSCPMRTTFLPNMNDAPA